MEESFVRFAVGRTGRMARIDGLITWFDEPCSHPSQLVILPGSRVDALGYVRIRVPNHPRGWGSKSDMTEHSVVMERSIGRFLDKGECVHHIDGNRQNNVLSNLQLMSVGDHGTHHHPKEPRGPCSSCGANESTRFVRTGGTDFCWKCYLKSRYIAGKDKGRKEKCVKCGHSFGYKRLINGVCGVCRNRM